MADPQKPTLDYSYVSFQQANQDSPFPGTQLDNDLANLKHGIDSTIDALKDVRRADGKLPNNIVDADALDNDLLIGLKTPEAWESGKRYVLLDTVYVEDTDFYGLYRCDVSHESALTFQEDLDAGYWELIFNFGGVQEAATEARDKARQWATNPVDDPVETDPNEFSALHHATKAAASASGASSSADAAASSASSASNSADTATAAADTATAAAGTATSAAGTAQTSAGQAMTAASNAQDSEQAAAASANAAADSADEAADVLSGSMQKPTYDPDSWGGRVFPYESRAEVEAANVPASVGKISLLSDGVLLTYARDTSGTALTSGDGSNWSPAETPTPAHWGASPGVDEDQQPKIQNCIDFCAASGRKGIIPATTAKDYRIDSTVVFAANDLVIEVVGGAYFRPVNSSLLVAVQIGATSAPSRMNLKNLAVDRGSYDGATENIGFLWLESNQSNFENFESRLSKYNHKGAPTSGGCQQNTFSNMQAIGGYYNFWLRSSYLGFFNEHDWEGGRGFCTANTHTNFRVEPDRTTGVLYVTTAGITGTFTVGETITGGTSGATASITSIDTSGSDTRIFFDSKVGEFEESETITGGTSGATGSPNRVRRPGAQHNRVSMSLEGSAVQGIYDDETANSWIQCRSEGTWSSGYFHVCGPNCAYPLIISSRYDYTLDKTNAYRATILTYQQGLEVNTAVDGRTSAKIVRSGNNVVLPSAGGSPAMEIRDEGTSGFSQLIDGYHRRDGADSYFFRSIRAVDGLVRSSLTTDGRLKVARQFINEQSAWNFQPLILGSYYLWVDSSGRLRIKGSAPTSETDGTIVGTQT